MGFLSDLFGGNTSSTVVQQPAPVSGLQNASNALEFQRSQLALESANRVRDVSAGAVSQSNLLPGPTAAGGGAANQEFIPISSLPPQQPVLGSKNNPRITEILALGDPQTLTVASTDPRALGTQRPADFELAVHGAVGPYIGTLSSLPPDQVVQSVRDLQPTTVAEELNYLWGVKIGLGEPLGEPGTVPNPNFSPNAPASGGGIFAPGSPLEQTQLDLANAAAQAELGLVGVNDATTRNINNLITNPPAPPSGGPGPAGSGAGSIPGTSAALQSVNQRVVDLNTNPPGSSPAEQALSNEALALATETTQAQRDLAPLDQAISESIGNRILNIDQGPTPEQQALIDRVFEGALASGREEIGRFTDDQFRVLREELAPGLGLRPSDTPILDRGGLVAREALRADSQLLNNLLAQSASSSLSLPLDTLNVAGSQAVGQQGIRLGANELAQRLRESLLRLPLDTLNSTSNAAQGLGALSLGGQQLGESARQFNTGFPLQQIQTIGNASTQQQGLRLASQDLQARLRDQAQRNRLALLGLGTQASTAIATGGGGSPIFPNPGLTQSSTGSDPAGGFSSILGGAGGLLSGLGAAGVFAPSSREFKTDKRPVSDILPRLDVLPVEAWTYKKGVADEGTHIGPYAEDFKILFGVGDGKTINLLDAMGVNMKATKELSAEVADLNTRLSEVVRRAAA